MSTNLLRVHDELSKVAMVTAGLDEGVPTEIKPSAILAADNSVDELV